MSTNGRRFWRTRWPAGNSRGSIGISAAKNGTSPQPPPVRSPFGVVAAAALPCVHSDPTHTLNLTSQPSYFLLLSSASSSSQAHQARLTWPASPLQLQPTGLLTRLPPLGRSLLVAMCRLQPPQQPQRALICLPLRRLTRHLPSRTASHRPARKPSRLQRKASTPTLVHSRQLPWDRCKHRHLWQLGRR